MTNISVNLGHFHHVDLDLDLALDLDFGDRRHNLEIRQNVFPATWDNFEVMAPVPEILESLGVCPREP
jgi:hypothetical protein